MGSSSQSGFRSTAALNDVGGFSSNDVSAMTYTSHMEMDLFCPTYHFGIPLKSTSPTLGTFMRIGNGLFCKIGIQFESTKTLYCNTAREVEPSSEISVHVRLLLGKD